MISTIEYSGHAIAADRRIGWSGLMVGTYLGFAGIYWLPGVSITLVAALKLALVGAAVFAVFSASLAKNSFSLPSGLLGPVGYVLVLIAAAPGLFQSTPANALDVIKDLTLSFLFLWTFYSLAKRRTDIHVILRIAVVIVAFFCLLTVMSLALGWPTWTSPFESNRIALYLTGFTAKRTGWSGSLALVFPLCMLFLVPKAGSGGRVTAGARFLFYITSVLIIASQVICGGRAGLLASLVSGALLFMFSPARRSYGVLVLGAVIASIFLSEYLFDQLRIYRLAADQFSASTFDSFSAGRLAGYVLAVDLISQRPLVGHGFGRLVLTDFGIGYQEIHNLWLRLATESGVVLPLTFAGMVGTILVRIRILFRIVRSDERTVVYALAAVVVGGLLLTMFEPNTLVGTFQSSAAWWAALGALLGIASRSRDVGYRQEPSTMSVRLR